MRMQILLLLTAAVSASNVIFEYSSKEHLTESNNDKFHCIEKPKIDKYATETDDKNNDGGHKTWSKELSSTSEGLVIECKDSYAELHPWGQGAHFTMLAGDPYPIQSGNLAIEMTSKTQIFEVENHLFGQKIDDPQTDHRLGCTAISLQGELGMAFSFVFTNGKIYAFMTNTQATSKVPNSQYLIPLIDTVTGMEHTVKFVVNSDSKSIAWVIDDQQLYLWQQGTPVEQCYCIYQCTEGAEPEFPANEVYILIGVWSFWGELWYTKEDSAMYQKMLEDVHQGLESVFEPRPQDSIDLTDENGWCPGIRLTIKSVKVTQDL